MARSTLQGNLQSWLASANNVAPSTSNQPAQSMAFQRWFKFKEAFAPSFVVETIGRLPYRPTMCLDPFGGSGTTALTCQFLGIKSVTVEVNPFMADVVEAKLTQYDPTELRRSFRYTAGCARRAWKRKNPAQGFPNAPSTFVEPGEGGRWIFNRDVSKAILALKSGIDDVPKEHHRRFLRIMLGSRLVEVSNILVNGKGRRYRRNWHRRAVSAEDVLDAFDGACSLAIADIEAFASKRRTSFKVLNGDAREIVRDCPEVDLVLTSPPYPNSFDYTDIYNIELWALGYLSSQEDNRNLRNSTVRSHVQITHQGEPAYLLSPTLTKTYRALAKRRENLWNRRIPEMLCHYFEDLQAVLQGCKAVLKSGGYVVLAVGNSRYDGILINVPIILEEVVDKLGFDLIRTEAVRSMRTSAQQGGSHLLNESLIWLSVKGPRGDHQRKDT